MQRMKYSGQEIQSRIIYAAKGAIEQAKILGPEEGG